MAWRRAKKETNFTKNQTQTKLYIYIYPLLQTNCAQTAYHSSVLLLQEKETKGENWWCDLI